MSSAHVSDATTNPFGSRPIDRGRTPKGSRAAKTLRSSIITKQKAPLSFGSTCMQASSSPPVSVICCTSSVVTMSESVVAAPDGHHGRQLVGVDQVAVVPERQRVGAVGLEHGLGVVPRGGAGGRVPRVADREVAVQRGQRGFVEDLADEAEVLEHQDRVVVADRDAGRFLATMLLGEETEVGEPRDVVARSPHPEESALLLRRFGSHEDASLPAGGTGGRANPGLDQPAVRSDLGGTVGGAGLCSDQVPCGVNADRPGTP